MTEIKINEFIVIWAFDNRNDFFRKVEGSDVIAMLEYSYLKMEKLLLNYKSHLSIMQSWVVGNNTIENNKLKILEEVKKLSEDKKFIIIRYQLPEITPIYSENPVIIGCKTISRNG